MVDSNSVFTIDVNSKESFRANQIGENSIHFKSTSKGDFEKALAKHKGKAIVAYCGGPSCGAWKRGAIAACKLGYKNIRHYKDGIKGWVSSGQAPKGKG